MLLERGKVKAKLDEKGSAFNHHYQEKEEPRRINLNDLLKRTQEEKAKIKKTNVLVFSAVLASAGLVVVIITFL